jgi:hypothetical protein
MDMKQAKRLSTILDIVYSHQADCLQSNCQCKKIKENYDNTAILLENIYNKLNFFRNTSINLLYFEYLLIVKKNYLFAYGILKTYIYKHEKKMDIFELLHCYTLLFNAVELYYKTNIWQMNTFLLFNDIHDQIRLTHAFNKKFRKIIGNFDLLINFKDRFDNCLKLNNGIIDSYIFSEIDSIVTYCKDFHKTYKMIKQSIRSNFDIKKCRNFELSYRLSIFFKLFNKKTPLSLLKLMITEKDDTYNIIQQDYDNNNNYQLITLVNEIFRVKYISYPLVEILGYKYEDIIEHDLHNLFPKQLAESHKKVILKHILIDNQYKMTKKTWTFTNYNSLIPVNLQVCSFPNFNCHLQFITNLEILKDDDKKIFIFMLSENLELMAMNTCFENYYDINYTLLRKLNLDFLKMFDISRDHIGNRFRDSIISIRSQKEIKNFFFVFSNMFNLNLVVSEMERQYNQKDSNNYTQNIIANLRSDSNNTSTVGRTDHKLLSNDFKSTTSMNIKNPKPELKPVKKDNELPILIVNKSKSILIRNLEKFQHKNQDIDLTVENLENLDNSIKFLKLDMREFNYFKIKITLKNFIDYPFYLIKIIDIKKYAPNEEENKTPSGKNNFVSFTKNSFNGSKGLSLRKIRTSNKMIGKDNYNIFDNPEAKENTDHKEDMQKKKNKLIRSSYLEGIFSTSIKGTNIFRSFKNSEATAKGKNKVIVSLLFILCFLISLHSFIFYYKNYFIGKITNDFQVSFWNLYQKSTFNFLYTAVLTWIFRSVGITGNPEFKIPDSSSIKKWTEKNRECSVNFYNSVIVQNDATLINMLYKKDKTFSKININFDDIQYLSSFELEANYLQFGTTQLTNESSFESVYNSLVYKFLYQKFKSDTKQSITDFDKIIYFVNNNINAFLEIAENIENYLLTQSATSYMNTKNVIYIFEFLILATSIFLILLIRFILVGYDKKFFKIIISMFINLNKTEVANYKTPVEILILKSNMKNFGLILDNIDTEITHPNDLIMQANKVKPTPKKESNGDLNTKSISFTKVPFITDKQNLSSMNNITDNTKSGIQTSHVNFINNKNLLDKKLFDKNGNKVIEEELQIITNNNILNDTKHYEIKFVKIAKVLFFIGLLIFLTLSALNICTSIFNFDFYYDVNIISQSFLSRFSIAVQYMNQARLIVYSNDRSPQAQAYFNKITTDIGLNNDNKTIFVNDYSKSLPNTNAYFNLITATISDANRAILCPNDAICYLNSKGINEAYNSAVRLTSLIYLDFINSNNKFKNLEDIVRFFDKDYDIANTELDDVFGIINNDIFDKVITDTYAIIDDVHKYIIILGIVSLMFNILIVLYVILVFISRMKNYLAFIVYSADKFNNALYKE